MHLLVIIIYYISIVSYCHLDSNIISICTAYAYAMHNRCISDEFKFYKSINRVTLIDSLASHHRKLNLFTCSRSYIYGASGPGTH